MYYIERRCRVRRRARLERFGRALRRISNEIRIDLTDAVTAFSMGFCLFVGIPMLLHILYAIS